MRRLAKVGVAGCTLVLLTSWITEVVVGIGLSPEIRAQAAAIDEQRSQRDRFVPHFNEILRRVASGQPLRDASETLERAAAEHHPAFLDFAFSIGFGNSLRTKLAWILIGHLENSRADEFPAMESNRLAELVREFDQMMTEDALVQ